MKTMMTDIRLHVSVAVIREGRLLLVQESKPENFGKWNLPGGHLEDDESTSDGALRELREETGLDGVLTAFLGVYRTHKPGYQAARFVYRADATGEPEPGDQIQAVRWFEPEEVEALSPKESVGNLQQVARDAFSPQNYLPDVVRG